MSDEVTNEDRAQAAQAAVDAFADIGRMGPHDMTDELIQDLIGDLCHLARARGHDPVELVRNALSGFHAEENDEQEADVVITIVPQLRPGM